MRARVCVLSVYLYACMYAFIISVSYVHLYADVCACVYTHTHTRTHLLLHSKTVYPSNVFSHTSCAEVNASEVWTNTAELWCDQSRTVDYNTILVA